MRLAGDILEVTLKDLLSKVKADQRDSLTNVVSVGMSRYRRGLGKSWVNWENPEYRSERIIDYATVPSTTREKYELPELEELKKTCAAEILEQRLRYDDEAQLYFEQNHPCIYEIADDHARLASWLMMVAPIGTKEAKQMGFRNIDDLYLKVIELLVNRAWPFKVSSNLQYFRKHVLGPFRRLFFEGKKQRTDHYQNDEYRSALDTLVSSKYGNKNRAKINGNENQDRQVLEMQAEVIRIYANGQIKLNVEETWKAFNLFAKDKVSAGDWVADKASFKKDAMHNFLYRPEIKQQWYKKRHGNREYRRKFDRNTQREMISMANAKWVIDGTPWHRYYVWDGYAYARINVFVVLDAYSWAVIGVYISKNENSDQVMGALRNACLYSGTLMGEEQRGFRPHEVQSDNSAPIKSWHTQHAIEVISQKNVPAKPGNAKSKMVEPFFKHFNSRVLKFRPGFTGSIEMTRTLDNRVNPDALMAQLKGGLVPNEKQMMAEMWEDFEAWNNDRSWNNADVPEHLRKSPIEKYRESVAATIDQQLRFTPEMDVKAFWFSPGKMVQIPDTSASKRKMVSVFKPQLYSFTNNGFQIDRKHHLTGEKVKVTFDVPNAEFNASYIDERFMLKIHPETMDKAYLFYEDYRPVVDLDNNRIIATPKEKQTGSFYDRIEGDAKRLAEHEQIKKDQQEIVKGRLNRYEQVSAEMGRLGKPITRIDVYGGKDSENDFKIGMMEDLANSELGMDKVPLTIEEAAVPDESKPRKFNRYAS